MRYSNRLIRSSPIVIHPEKKNNLDVLGLVPRTQNLGVVNVRLYCALPIVRLGPGAPAKKARSIAVSAMRVTAALHESSCIPCTGVALNFIRAPDRYLYILCHPTAQGTALGARFLVSGHDGDDDDDDDGVMLCCRRL